MLFSCYIVILLYYDLVIIYYLRNKKFIMYKQRSNFNESELINDVEDTEEAAIINKIPINVLNNVFAFIRVETALVFQ